MYEAGVLGVGLTRFTKHRDRDVKSLVEEAVAAALADADVKLADVGVIFAGSAYATRNGNGQTCLRDLPTNGTPIVNIENACASGSSALFEAYAWIKAGLCDVALAIGMDMTSWVDGKLPMPGGVWYADLGLLTPNWYGLQASRYLAQHGLSAEVLADVAVKSRAVAVHNPYAHFQKSVTREEVLASPMIATPFTLHQCCPKTDAAGVVVLVSADYARRRGSAVVPMRAAAMASGQPAFSNVLDEPSAAATVAARAFGAAGIGPNDLDVLELHDAFTIGECLYSEAAGLCAPGGYPDYLRAGLSMPNGGGVAVNPSGGLLSRGHPIGATGMAQVAEVVWQLRGTAGGRQVENARWGATLTMGAVEWEREANIAACFVFGG